MQCIWYAFGIANSHVQTSRFGLALKRFNQIKTHFVEFLEDMIDFHAYAGRKQTLRNYVGLLNEFGTIYGHKYYVKAAKAAISTHLYVFEGGEAAEMMVDGVSLGNVTSDIADFSESERKKMKNKAKKSETRSKFEPLNAAEKRADEDLFGTKLVVGVDHLVEATNFLKPLLSQASIDKEILELGCQVFLARSKRLGCNVEKFCSLLKCLFYLEKFYPDSPAIHVYSSKAAILLPSASLAGPLKDLLLSETRTLLKHDGSSKSIILKNGEYLQSNDLKKIAAAAEVLLALETEPALPLILHDPSSWIDQINLKVCSKHNCRNADTFLT